MRLTSYINNFKCLEWGLNLQQGALFDLLIQSAGWAEAIYIDGEVYYWVSKNKICEEIPLAYSKPDTAYRALKSLEENGLILYTKFGAKDCISITEKGKEWNSEINPSLGNKSEQTRKNIRKSSEINPTYKTTNDNSTNDNKYMHFEQWWAIYPRKINKQKAWQSWNRQKLDSRVDELIEKLSQQIAMQYAFTDINFIPYPASYLNAGAWDNPIEYKNPMGGNHATAQSTKQPSLLDRVYDNCEQAERSIATANGSPEENCQSVLVQDDGIMDGQVDT